ncbi:MAG TPA: hypothetical protein VKV02_00800 [Acidobacteriaceae bacterium]|nr:hypothetical protein [Acidobacteriaceae bacterium]
MSKGWESKSVEEQQAAAETRSEAASAAVASRDDAARKRRIRELELQRERVLSEKTSNPHRRTALQMALATIEKDLQDLGWLIHL